MDPFLKQLPQDLQSRIISVVNIVPESLDVFEKLYTYANEAQLSRKSRKSEIQELNHEALKMEAPEASQTIFKLEDVSVVFPLRKKMDVVLYLSPNSRKPILSLIKDDKIEVTIENLGKDITMATFLPVAEKQNKLYLFIKYSKSKGGKYSDPILITLSEDILLSQFKKSGIFSNDIDDVTKCIEYMRKQAILAGFRIADPFFSTHQDINDDSSFHVECHRGTKEGTLYFLPDHIIFGFKKPILVFDSSDIESITYSSITRLTFNVTMVTKDEQKFEFSMIDQNEYTKIDDYVKRKQVKDKSMSEELKAKSKNKSTQQSNEITASALEEATQQMQNEADKGGLDIKSEDDEENDQNFEAESDLSDGSGSENESVDEQEFEDQESEDQENEEEGNREGDNMSSLKKNSNMASNDVGFIAENMNIDVQNNGLNEYTVFGSETATKNKFSLSLGLEDIPIEVNDDDDDIDDDDEGSGVEY